MDNGISRAQYDADFLGKKKEALERALDIRKFEIELYWKRASYFWTLIGATLAGYAVIQASSSNSKDDVSVFLASLGLVFSFAWFLVNKGSKQWQENWENHVDLLEDDVVGPLYKTVLTRPEAENVRQTVEGWVTGPGPFSVSKINQILSIFVILMWIFLLLRVLLPFSFCAPVNWQYVLLIGTSLVFCAAFVACGQTDKGKKRRLVGNKRRTYL